MTAQDKAKAGVWLLQQALLDYLGTRAEGATSAEIREALSLKDADAKGEHEGYLLWGLLNLLTEEGKVEFNKMARPQRIILKR